MTPRFLIAVLTALFAFAGTAAVAADADTYGSMDANSDGQISEAEFTGYYDDSDIFDMWDVNDDGWIDDDEFGDGLFDYYDDDDDGYIDDAEWDDGIMVDDYGDNGFWDM